VWLVGEGSWDKGVGRGGLRERLGCSGCRMQAWAEVSDPPAAHLTLSRSARSMWRVSTAAEGTAALYTGRARGVGWRGMGGKGERSSRARSDRWYRSPKPHQPAATRHPKSNSASLQPPPQPPQPSPKPKPVTHLMRAAAAAAFWSSRHASVTANPFPARSNPAS